MSKAAAVAMALLLIPLAGCVGPDGATGGDPPEGDDAAEAPCETGRSFEWFRGFQTTPDGTGHTGEDRECWWNWEHASADNETFYFFVGRRGGNGTWDVTLRDGVDSVFFEHSFGPGREVVCEDEGRSGIVGNWTADLAWSNLTGFVRVRVDIGEKGDWTCP